jgi:predicted HicB family RNase H-like nuclease
VNPRTPMGARAVRVPSPLWEQALAVASARGESLSEVIRAALVAYVKRYGKDLGVPGE